MINLLKFSCLFLCICFLGAMHPDDPKDRPHHLLTYGTNGSVFHNDDQLFIGQYNSSLDNGLVYVYSLNEEGNYSKDKILCPIPEAKGYQFGHSIAAHGDYLVIGAPNRVKSKGKTFLFKKNNFNEWIFQKVLTPKENISRDFGSTVYIDDKHILIADRYLNGNQGAVFSFFKDDDQWVGISSLRNSSLGKDSFFGHSMDISANFAAIGSRDGNVVTEYIFDTKNNNWKQFNAIYPNRIQKKGHFGFSVAYYGEQLIIGYPGFENIGNIQIYSLSNGRREHYKTINSPNNIEGGFFGSSIDVANNQLAVGSFNGEAVSLYEFTIDGTIQFQKKLSTNNTKGGKFGRSISLSTDQIIIGAGYKETSFLFKRLKDNEWQFSFELKSQINIESLINSPQPCNVGNLEDYYPEIGRSNDLYPCSGIDMQSFLNPNDLGGNAMNDIWGWTDPLTGKEIAIVGLTNGTAFVDISDPINPKVLGHLLSNSNVSTVWRDMKVYKDHVFIVADFYSPTDHGIQIFDLKQLRDVDSFTNFTNYFRYDLVGSVHNIAINEETGYAYAMGITSAQLPEYQCGLHMVDISDPQNPTFAGCMGDETTGRYNNGYIHDAQIVIYDGPDNNYKGKEIAFTCNETALGIADVTDKANIKIISKNEEGRLGYVHQGWLSEDHRYFFVNDELNEIYGYDDNQTMLIFDVSDLDDPKLVSIYDSGLNTVDHNNFVVGNLLYQSNYSTGLRVLDISDPLKPKEVAYFDTYPSGNIKDTVGSWGNYPFFKSRNIPVTSIDEGLYILKVNEGNDLSTQEDIVPQEFELFQNFPNPFNPSTKIKFNLSETKNVVLKIYDINGKEIAELTNGIKKPGIYEINFNAKDMVSGIYLYQLSVGGRSITKKMSYLR